MARLRAGSRSGWSCPSCNAAGDGEVGSATERHINVTATLYGGAGDDTQDGGNGNDRIYANVGVDTTAGGEGEPSTLQAFAQAFASLGRTVHQQACGDRYDHRI